MKRLSALLLFCGILWACPAAPTHPGRNEPVRVRVDAARGRIPISPYIYGMNGAAGRKARLVREAAVRISRESHGNNCTKYNWREDLSSHPDWYNNVYEQNAPERARRLQEEHRGLQILFGFQALGWVAETDEFNFPWQPEPRPAPHRNLCGDGKPELYLRPWSAQDTAAILDHWFSPGGPGLNPRRFRYWHIDNEPGCWPSTHDDVCPEDLTAEDVVQRYAAVARQVKSRHPDIRLMAPGFTSEWMWWNFRNQFVNGMPWMEFFIERMAEESRRFGRPLVDVVDFHTYVGGEPPDAELLQEHRIFYDAEYEFPRANGVKRFPDGGWHEEQRVEMIFARTEAWLDEYFGAGHGITIGVTEAGPSGSRPPMVNALWYASMLGTFADHGVEVFTPWGWRDSWWEVLHLFSRYGRQVRVEAECSGEPTVSAYASVGEAGDGMTIFLLNRHPDVAPTVRIALRGFDPIGGKQLTLTLSDLPEGKRTFHSHEDNALRRGTARLQAGTLSIQLPPHSIVAAVLEGETGIQGHLPGGKE